MRRRSFLGLLFGSPLASAATTTDGTHKTQYIDENGTPAMQVRGLYGNGRDKPEAVLEAHPDNPSEGAVRLHLAGYENKQSLFLGRLWEGNGTVAPAGEPVSDEMLKVGRDTIALEAGGPAKLRLQSSNQSSAGRYPIETNAGVQVETYDSRGQKVTRMRFFQGKDRAAVSFPNVGEVQLQDDTVLSLGNQDDGQLSYDSDDGSVRVDGGGNLRLTGITSEPGVSKSDLEPGEIRIDEDGKLVWKDGTGDAYEVSGAEL